MTPWVSWPHPQLQDHTFSWFLPDVWSTPTQNSGPADDISPTATLLVSLFTFVMFSVLGSLMPALGRMGTSWASGKRMRKKWWRWPKGSSGTGNVTEDALHQDELKCMAPLSGKAICQTGSTYWMPTYPTNFLPPCCTWTPVSWLTNTCPLFVTTLDLGSCQSPSTWCSFSPPGFACWLALLPGRFLSHVPAWLTPALSLEGATLALLVQEPFLAGTSHFHPLLLCVTCSWPQLPLHWCCDF